MPHDVDNGCEYHPSCFTCPFVTCLWDIPGGPSSYFAYKEFQDLIDSGMTKLEATRKLGLSVSAGKQRRAKAISLFGTK